MENENDQKVCCTIVGIRTDSYFDFDDLYYVIMLTTSLWLGAVCIHSRDRYSIALFVTTVCFRRELDEGM